MATLLYVIGAQKAGTTWLSEYFRKHPQVYVPPIKELHFFSQHFLPRELVGSSVPEFSQRLQELWNRREEADEEERRAIEEEVGAIIDRLAMTPKTYLPFFEKRMGDESVFVDNTPAYALLKKNHFETLDRIHPDVKFVYLLRDPVERAWSQFRMLERDRNIPAEQSVQRFPQALRNETIYLRSNYVRTLHQLLQAVPRSQVFLGFYENLFQEKSIRSLCDFLLIEERPADFDEKVNAGDEIELPSQLREAARRYFQPVYQAVGDFFGRLGVAVPWDMPGTEALPSAPASTSPGEETLPTEETIGDELLFEEPPANTED